MIEHSDDTGLIATEWEPIEVVLPRAIANINSMRDALIEGGFDYAKDSSTYRIQTRPSDRENITTLGQMATLAVMSGVEVGDLDWLGNGQPFVFLTADNQVLPMDAHDMMSMFRQAMAFKSAATFNARSLKDAVLAATTDQEVSAIDLNAGWPGE